MHDCPRMGVFGWLAWSPASLVEARLYPGGLPSPPVVGGGPTSPPAVCVVGGPRSWVSA